jgi:hypothetical protein
MMGKTGLRGRGILAMASISAFCATGCGGDGPGSSEQTELRASALASTLQASFLTFNICGSSGSEYCQGDPIPALVDFILKHRPTAFALQEVCGYQADQISRMLRDRGLDYVQRYMNLSLGGVSFCGDSPSDRLKGEGVALFHAGTGLGAVREGRFETHLRTRQRGYVCVKVPQPEFWACATHIELPPPDAPIAIQKAQVEQLAEVAQDLTVEIWPVDGKRVPVVVGGDFNAHPSDPSLDPLFDKATYVGGSGGFFENDVHNGLVRRPDGTVRFERTFDDAAKTQGDNKLDYVFHSGNPFTWTVKSTVYPGVNSDHRMLFNEFSISSGEPM